MSDFNGCYNCNGHSYCDCHTPFSHDCSSCHPCGPKFKCGSWLLPVLFIFAALCLSGGFSWLLILLGIILLFKKELFKFIF